MSGIPSDNSQAGAQQFTDFYIRRLNEALTKGDPQLLAGLSVDTCKTCATWTSRVQNLRDASQHLTADLYTPSFVSTSKFSNNTAEVLIYGEQKGADVVNAEGAKVDTVPKVQKANFLFTVKFNDGWKVGLWQTEQ